MEPRRLASERGLTFATPGLPLQRWPLGRWPFAAVPLAIAGLAMLAAIVAGGGVGATDLNAARWLQSIDVVGWDGLIRVTEALSNTELVWLVGAGAVIVFALWRSWLHAAVMLVATGVWVPMAILQEIVARPRPSTELVEVLQGANGFGFPSGHVTASVAVYGMLVIMVMLRCRSCRSRALVAAPLLFLIAFSAAGRVVLGAHWPSDVIGALLLSGVWLALLTWAYTRFRGSRSCAGAEPNA